MLVMFCEEALVQETLAEPQNLGPMLVQSPQMLQKFEPKTD
jgi:hypothetical protein